MTGMGGEAKRGLLLELKVEIDQRRGSDCAREG